MPCSGITSEDYVLWSLGLLEGSGAELIRAHLTDGCETCTEAVREGVDFWAHYGAAASFDSRQAPGLAVRERLLEQIQSPRRPVVARLVYVGTLAAALLVIAIVWQFGRRREQAPGAPPVRADVQFDTMSRHITDLQEKLNASERELERLRTVSTFTPVPASLQKSAPRGDTLELERAINQANQQIQQLRTALAGEQAKSARLAQELDAQAASVAALSKERRDAEINLAAANGRLAERDRQIKALDVRIAQLERERDQLNDSLSNQKRRVEHAGRMIALLSAPATKFVRLAGTEAAPGASGYVILAEGKRLIFSGSNLPGLPAGRVYQLWLMRGRSPGIASAGVFVSGGEESALEFGDAALLNDVRGLAVTEEPAGGSRLPTGHKVLIGTTRS